ncbi:DUF2304 domain-containing protein [Culicoidibacter larvae]|uniref:DUF2304 domain-containing protein n=1 Tax=Culicoidibacter larvae TaxID=2579976 RepID=A0A5R8Q7K7_9FIRM|nr:DUF2304 domain-containing protein [Culicoidibacter larvae]TLG71111.1 DUF2304 domain-containing protein [Culicoidibacter larvae]
MNLTLRLLLIIASILTFLYMWVKVKKSQVQISDIAGWFLIGIGLIIIAIFPGLVSIFTNLFGFISDTNVVFLIMIFLLFILTFRQMLQISKLKAQNELLARKIAVFELDSKESRETKK